MDDNQKESLALETIGKVLTQLELMNYRVGIVERLPERIENLERAFMEHTPRCQDQLRKEFLTRNEFSPVKEGYVTKEEFRPVRAIVYGAVALICTLVFTALLAAVVTSGKTTAKANAANLDQALR